MPERTDLIERAGGKKRTVDEERKINRHGETQVHATGRRRQILETEARDREPGKRQRPRSGSGGNRPRQVRQGPVSEDGGGGTKTRWQTLEPGTYGKAGGAIDSFAQRQCDHKLRKTGANNFDCVKCGKKFRKG